MCGLLTDQHLNRCPSHEGATLRYGKDPNRMMLPCIGCGEGGFISKSVLLTVLDSTVRSRVDPCPQVRGCGPSEHIRSTHDEVVRLPTMG